MPLFSRKAASPAEAPPASGQADGFRLGPVRIFLLALLLVLVWLISMVVFVPAGWLWAQAAERLPLPPELHVEAVAGTLWSGSARAYWQRLPVQVGWTLEPGAIRHGFIPLEWRLSTPASSAEGSITATTDAHLRILLRRGRVDIAEVIELAGMNDVSAGGVAELESLFLIWSQEGWLDARGRGTWPGGPVRWPMGGNVERARLPALRADVNLETGDIVLRLRDQVEERTAVTLSVLGNQPVVAVQIRRHWLDLLGLEFGAGTDPDEVVFNVRHQLVP